MKPPLRILLLRALRRTLEEAADPARAPGMQAYMKSAMPYHGVPAGPARKIFKTVYTGVAFTSAAHWQETVLGIWSGATHREERYAAMALVEHKAARAFQTPEALPLYERMIVEGAWWDFVDQLAAHPVGDLVRAHPKALKPIMRRWSRDPDMWKRRTSIICQLASKDAIDLDLLYACIEPSLGSKEFFLRKAIGWALRQHAWTDPAEVRRYVAAQADALSPLSRREALKNLGPKA